MVFANSTAMKFFNRLVKWSSVVFLHVMLLLPASGRENGDKKGKPGHGTASYYADKFNGRKTANGETFSNQEMTAAHNSLPLGTYVKVTNTRNGRWVVVRITDRLHEQNTRIIDLTKKAAGKLGFIARGLTRVKVEVVTRSFVNSLIDPLLLVQR